MYSIKISMKFVPKCPISNISALNQIMAACYLPGNKPFSEPVIVSLLTDLNTVNKQPISHSHGWAMGCLLWGFGRKLTVLLRHCSVLINKTHPSDWIFYRIFYISLKICSSQHNCYFACTSLTHWGQDKMDAIFQTTFSNGYSWMKMYEFRFKFHWSLFLRFQLTIFQHWFR